MASKSRFTLLMASAACLCSCGKVSYEEFVEHCEPADIAVEVHSHEAWEEYLDALYEESAGWVPAQINTREISSTLAVITGEPRYGYSVISPDMNCRGQSGDP